MRPRRWRRAGRWACAAVAGAVATVALLHPAGPQPARAAEGAIAVEASAAPATLPAAATGEDLDRAIQRAILELGDPSVAVRQQATRKLWEIGRPAEPALQRATQDDDPEVAARAREVLADFRYGLYPDTPTDLADLVRRYRRAGGAERPAVLTELTRLGGRAFPVLVRLWTVEPPGPLRDAVLQQLRARPALAVPAFLAEGQVLTAEQMLETWKNEASEEGARAWAAYQVLRGNAPAATAALRKEVEAAGGGGGDAAGGRALPRAASARALAYLYRAAGDLEQATWAAERAEDPQLLLALRQERGDWKALAEAYEDNSDESDIEARGQLAAFQRLAGDARAAEATLDAIARRAGALDEDDARLAAEALLLNGRPAEGIKAVRAAKRGADLFELLAAQHRFDEALELAEAGLGLADPRLRALAVKQMSSLGLDERARRTLAELVEEAKEGRDLRKLEAVVEAASALGEETVALEHAALAIEGAGAARRVTRSMERLAAGRRWQRRMPADRGAEVAAWVDLMRMRAAGGKTADKVRRALALVDAKLPLDEVRELVREGLREAEREALMRPALRARREGAQPPRARGDAGVAGADAGGWQWEPAMRSAARVLAELGQAQEARALLRRIAELSEDADDLMLLADEALKLGRFAEAASLYAMATEKDRTAAAPRYLRGHALAKAGREGEGRALMEQAAVLPLADGRQRYALAGALARAGLVEASAEQYRLVLRTAAPASWETADALRVLAQRAYAAGKAAEAAALWERSMLEVLRADVEFVEPATYLTMPALVNRVRAMALLEAGDATGALRAAEAALASLPNDINVALELVPAFERRGHRTEADALYARLKASQQAVCEKYPDSATERNSLAWMMARVRRDLDEALRHAARAAELAPRDTAILDTLAEVHFQRGERAKAIELMKRCIELEPHNPRHRLALRRIETQDPKTEVPEE